MEKVLKKYTTIPQPLYVDRYADIQLKRIIEEMQRPGYVLVARQMGKTNLLFNAKRTLENANRLFAYVDLSNSYTNERDCYRNIINNVIEPNLHIFESIENDIEKIREKDLPPHNEYSRSLIKILSHFQGDLVIILDEIDALKSISYSDNIFAQIRSNYFSRTNYPVLERLTYVLSGVIEPTELIRDKNKSPFNIGDKIYLDDFTKEEHNNFIKKSKLEISDVLANEIFDWANGNPRLTFDICAEVENCLIQKGEMSSEILNNIISKKYLTSFDIAPIDHIRELTKSNKDIRKAILSIHKKSTSELSDDIKRKLYLYGIINSKFNEVTYIKNKIIETSLSEEWLKSIEKEKEVNFVYALAKYTERDFEGAINVFKEVLSNFKNEKEKEGCHYFLGLSYHKLNNLPEAIKHLSYNYKDESYKIDSLCHLGVCQIVTGDENGISTLEEAIKHERNNHPFHYALLSYALNINDSSKSLELLERLYNSTLISEYSDMNELNQLKTLSLYYQAEIFEKNENKEVALIKIEQALEHSSLSDSLLLLYNQHHFSIEKNEKTNLEIVNRIIDNKLNFEENVSYPISFSETHLYYYLDFAFKKNDYSLFEKLLDYTVQKLIFDRTRYEIIYNVSTISKTNEKDILDYLLNFSEQIDKVLLLNIYRGLIFQSVRNISQFLNLFNKYLPLFEDQKDITNSDIYIFAFCIKTLSEKKEIKEALFLCEIITEKIEKSEIENLRYESVIIYYWFSSLYFSNRDKINAIKYADIALNLIKISNGKKISMIDEAGLTSISNQLNQIKVSPVVNTEITITKKYNRNDWVKVKYLDGNVKEDKYKRLEADILSERCTLIE